MRYLCVPGCGSLLALKNILDLAEINAVCVAWTLYVEFIGQQFIKLG